jgi:hypothetical protein
MSAKSDTATTIKAAVQNASGHVQSAIVSSEKSVVGAVERSADALASLKATFDGVKEFGTQLTEVVDHAGRTALSGAAAINGSLMNYGKDLVADAMDVSRKTIETRSLQDAVELHTAFAERRLSAIFQTAAAVNSLAQHNVMAVFGPFASLVKNATGSADTTVKSLQKATFKTAA